MKFNIFHIITGHLNTLVDARTEKYSKSDFFFLYLLPCLIAGYSYYLGFSSEKSVYGVSISVFAIFSALLLNVQIAIFGIYQRKWWDAGDDKCESQKLKSKYEVRKTVLRELNTSISYLILISCFSVTLFLAFYIFNFAGRLEFAVSVLVYTHFILVLLVVIKRTHALFENEYSIDGDVDAEKPKAKHKH